MPDLIEFDFKKEIKKLICSELRPVLFEQGFILSKPTTYIREMDGLLQEFNFKIGVSKLRPWVSYRPIFDARGIVTFGTDRIYTHDCLDPYRGYQVISLEDWYFKDPAHRYKNYTKKSIPQFEKLKQSIVKAVLPELNEIDSLDKFITAYQENAMLFHKKAQTFSSSQLYFDFIFHVRYSHGIKRMSLLIKEMENWELPKVVSRYLEECKEKCNTDQESNKIFEEYIEKIRIANKLVKKGRG